MIKLNNKLTDVFGIPKYSDVTLYNLFLPIYIRPAKIKKQKNAKEALPYNRFIIHHLSYRIYVWL